MSIRLSKSTSSRPLRCDRTKRKVSEKCLETGEFARVSHRGVVCSCALTSCIIPVATPQSRSFRYHRLAVRSRKDPRWSHRRDYDPQVLHRLVHVVSVRHAVETTVLAVVHDQGQLDLGIYGGSEGESESLASSPLLRKKSVQYNWPLVFCSSQETPASLYPPTRWSRIDRNGLMILRR